MEIIYIAVIGDWKYGAISFDNNKIISIIEQCSEQEIKQWIEDYSKEYEVEILYYTTGIVKAYKSCINCFGGKFYMKDKIIGLFPEHIVYVEGFGGAAHVLFRKSPSLAEVYNDKDIDKYKFFHTIQNDTLRQLLKTQLSSEDISNISQYEEEFKKSQTILPTDDDILRIKKFYVRTMMSRDSIGKTYSKSNFMRGGRPQKINQFRNQVDKNMDLCGERLKGVITENLDILELIDKYDCKDTFFYLDPPYLPSTRVSKNVYKHEMSYDMHVKMVDKLKTVEGKVLLSGYDNELYDELGWEKQILGEYKKRSSSSGSKGIEMVWKNY